MRQQTMRIGFSARTLAAALMLTAGAEAVRADVCGDLNGDGEVDMSDGGILLAAFERNDNGDIDGDGDTDQQDLAWFLTHFLCGYGSDFPPCGPCAPFGTGTIEVDLVPVDNTSVGPGDDPEAPEFNGGVTHFTFDLVATVTTDNDWTTQSSDLEILHPEVAFFNHGIGGNTEPISALINIFPALEFDSFYAAPPPSSSAGGWASPGVRSGPTRAWRRRGLTPGTSGTTWHRRSASR